MYFDNASAKFRQYFRDSFTVSIEFAWTMDDWRLVRADSYGFPYGGSAQGEKL
jgi:hypothetical protein